MIASFPVLCPGELFYSGLAYAFHISSARNQKGFLENFVGSKHAGSGLVALPNGIANFVAVTKSLLGYSAREIIYEHTLFPYYSAFMTKIRANALMSNMISGDGRKTPLLAGICKSTIPQDKNLYFCPVCSKDDVETYGRPYWHNIHQVPYIQVCPNHAVFLEHCTLFPNQNLIFIPAEDGIFETIPRPLDMNLPLNNKLLFLSRTISQLFKISYSGKINDGNLGFYYRSALSEKGLATSIASQVHGQRLYSNFIDFYSSELLESLHCYPNVSDPHNWLINLLRQENVAHHPIRHLLLVLFISDELSVFVRNIPQYESRAHPFGSGPWPCLNKASDHYLELRIKTCELMISMKTKRPKGIFRCKCGFVYSILSNNYPLDLNRPQYDIVELGAIWKQKLREAWKQGGRIEKIAEKMGVSIYIAKFESIRMGVLPPRYKGRMVATIHRRIAQKNFLKKKHRHKWIQTVNANKRLGIRKLAALIPGTFAWLSHFDNRWYREHKPTTEIREKRKTNWEAMDNSLAPRIDESTNSLLNREGKPIRITIAAISTELGLERNYLQPHLRYLPNTKEKVLAAIETDAEFAIRRVQKGIKYFPQNHKKLSKLNRLARFCNITGGVRDNLSVIKALEDALK